MNIGVLFLEGVDIIIFFVLVLMCFVVVFLVRNRFVDLIIMLMFILFYLSVVGFFLDVMWIVLLFIIRLLLFIVILLLNKL